MSDIIVIKPLSEASNKTNMAFHLTFDAVMAHLNDKDYFEVKPDPSAQTRLAGLTIHVTARATIRAVVSHEED